MDAFSVINRLAGGEFLNRLSKALTDVAEGVVATGGNPGTVTVVFKMKLFRKDDVLVLVEEAIKEAPPVPTSRGAMFYAVGDGTLEKDDPRQPVMAGFRTVDLEPMGERELALEPMVLREVALPEVAEREIEDEKGEVTG